MMMIIVGWLSLSYISLCTRSFTAEFLFGVSAWSFIISLVGSAFLSPGHWQSPRRAESRINPERQYCTDCDVTEEESNFYSIRHCHICGVCIMGYDHHCGVVGNCIGESNIWFFRAMVCTGFIGNMMAYLLMFYTFISCYGSSEIMKMVEELIPSFKIRNNN